MAYGDENMMKKWWQNTQLSKEFQLMIFSKFHLKEMKYLRDAKMKEFLIN